MENSLTFSATLDKKKDVTIEAGKKAIQAMRESAEKAGLSDMSLEEINAEIAASRAKYPTAT